MWIPFDYFEFTVEKLPLFSIHQKTTLSLIFLNTLRILTPSKSGYGEDLHIHPYVIHPSIGGSLGILSVENLSPPCSCRIIPRLKSGDKKTW